MKETIYFVLPAYNEEANIEEVIAQWHPVCERINAEGNEAHLVIANDGSKDRTFAIMQNLQSKYPLLKPLDKPNSGHGATVLYLYRYAIEDSKKSGLSTLSEAVFLLHLSFRRIATGRLCRMSFGKCGTTATTTISK